MRFTDRPRHRIRFFCGVFIALAWLTLSPAKAQSTNYMLGTSALLVSPAAGTNSVVLAVTPSTGAWTATTNAMWLHLSTANQSGTGSTNVIFVPIRLIDKWPVGGTPTGATETVALPGTEKLSVNRIGMVIFTYDANSGSTRSGTLTVGGQTLTVTQAGSGYVAAVPPVETLALTTTTNGDDGLPIGLAIDNAGNVYIVDLAGSAIYEWIAADMSLTTLVSSGLNHPEGIALDSAGNVYVADSGNAAVKEWMASNGNVTTLYTAT